MVSKKELTINQNNTHEKIHDFFRRNPKKALIFSIIYTISWLTLYFIIWSIGFVGEKKRCATDPERTCFCEYFSFDNPLGQNTLTLTNLAYVFSGICIIIYYLKLNNIGESLKNNLSSKKNLYFENLSLYSFLYAILTINIGISSWFMHASGYKWAGIFDTYCMHMFISFIFIHSIVNLCNWNLKKFFILFVISEILLFILNITNVFDLMSRNDLFGILILLTIGFELILLILNKYKRNLPTIRDWKYLTCSIFSFIVGYIIWNMQKTEIWPCNPYSLIQPHALWHIITAIATWFIFLYLKSEKKV